MSPIKKNESIITDQEITEMLELTVSDFKTTIINILKDLKKNENMMKGDIETIKRQKQKQNLELEKCNI